MNKVAKNFFSMGFSTLVSQFLTFFTGTYAAHVLGKSGFGDITTVQAITLYFSIVVLFGLQTYGTREISKNKENIKDIVGEITLFRIIVFGFSFIVILILALVLSFNSRSIAWLLVLYSLTLLTNALCIDWVYNGLQEMKYNALYNIIKSLIPFVLIVLFLKNPSQVNYYAVFTVLGLAVATIYQFYIYFFREKLKINFKISFDEIKKYSLYGWPFLLAGVLATINVNVDRIVIRFSWGSSMAGIYASAYYVISFLTNIVTIIFGVVFPLMISYFNEKNMASLHGLIKNVSKVIIAVIVPIVLGGIILSKEIIILLFGKAYESAYMPFSILLIYSLILFIREIYAYGLNAWNMEKKYLRAVVISSLFNLIINLLLTPKFGMNVAAIITVLSEVITILIMKYYSDKIIKVSKYTLFLKISIPCIGMGIITCTLKYYNVNIIFNIVLSALCYVTFVILFKYFTIEDIKKFAVRKS
ncbi:O-antigen/teichoic acid export membrane protein [Clostridium acetobutylicum]|uniref:Membrane protein involved in the export of O-antigen and teichoic acid, RfbX family n=1 Tax=Clostridium acetobutylicum (strain ATCC 824 / DSM 792 / JCM 1419 / IAM 19013 / LMG 5710 / NBRC 13948 / NRRL B-527 / VKM B-1787 / 2291 / W) TaxID=272562 RepID=Q97GQ2_CLOAB|nr:MULTISPECIES: flippase [Clostridium]AAK80270.1 Membrane protein involved in the export of O-antigen and teichoic acid, RfbX family [Clostridium acetobutylicum ATCC 824]ADZ21366.1 Membrane protein, RfbX family [Clostridium acetobutylicum EA 2018]AEI32274.1 RfbX family O-antigen/teichoic acid exporter membrane protein [Clostridium acetobutylicum DSM 1731]AWV79307.1 flippase [Clostridium acetobutylicum]MBC2394723.1 flippase [Clostridium acetobutylicum]